MVHKWLFLGVVPVYVGHDYTMSSEMGVIQAHSCMSQLSWHFPPSCKLKTWHPPKIAWQIVAFSDHKLQIVTCFFQQRFRVLKSRQGFRDAKIENGISCHRIPQEICRSLKNDDRGAQLQTISFLKSHISNRSVLLPMTQHRQVEGAKQVLRI